MPANDEQVGGTHYKGQPIEHVHGGTNIQVRAEMETEEWHL